MIFLRKRIRAFEKKIWMAADQHEEAVLHEAVLRGDRDRIDELVAAGAWSLCACNTATVINDHELARRIRRNHPESAHARVAPTSRRAIETVSARDPPPPPP